MKFQTVCVIAALLSGVAHALSCNNDNDCDLATDGKACVSGQCGCSSNSDCDNYGNDMCDTIGKKCHACLADADCSLLMACQTDASNYYCAEKCTTDSDCHTGDDDNYKCENSICKHGMSGCEWKDENTNDFAEKMITGNLVGIVIGIITIIVVSVPLCCGVCKDAKAGGCEVTKIIAGLAIFVGIFTMFIPLVGVSSATEAAIDDLCSGEDCECSDKNKEDFRGGLGFLGFVIAYIYAFGWCSVLLGILAASLACCVCCKCCGPLKDQPQAKEVIVGAVVPVGNPQGQTE